MNTPTPLRLFTPLLLIAMVALLLDGGCKKDDPGPIDPPGGGGGGGEGGSTPTDSIRLVALAAFESFANGLDYRNPAAYTAILQYFRSHPETYEASDTSGPRSIWARFKDGRIFIVSDDTETRTDTSTSRSLGKRTNRPRLAAGPTDNLPSNTRARILNALGPAFDPLFGIGATETVNDLQTWFSAAGYTNPLSGDASVGGLKLAQGDGVFYVSSHGSWGKTRSGQTAFGIWTTDEVTPANETRFSTDLNSSPARLCWYRALDNNNIIGQNRRSHYAITAQFVQDYMRFGTNSLVFINACRSDAPESPDFKAACIAKGAGVYLGWTNNINCQTGLKSARFFFDRLLGANRQSPLENPPQRPFEVTYVLEDMLLRGLDTHSTDKGATKLTATPPYGYGADPTLLAPGLKWAIPPFIQGDVNVLIDGAFGDNPGAGGIVMLGNNALTVADWTPSRIECPAPQSGGNLSVKVRGIKSNTIQLTEWHAQFTLIYRGRGSLQHRVVLNLNFWADIHNWRVLPNKPANFWTPRDVYAMSNSTCTFESSGEYRNRLDTTIVEERWADAVPPPFERFPTGGAGFGLTGMIDSIGRVTSLYIVFRAQYTRYLREAGSTQVFTPPGSTGTIQVVMTNAYALPGGSIPWSSGDNSATMTWAAMQPTYPPSPTDGR